MNVDWPKDGSQNWQNMGQKDRIKWLRLMKAYQIE